MSNGDAPTGEGEQHEPGRLVAGRYRLRATLGTGTTGLVWSAYDEVLYRWVAVKEVLLPSGMPDAEAHELRERTMREARAIAALSHPNVVAVYDVSRVDGAPFVVMELVEGRSLARLLRGGARLDTTQAATVADGVASALEAAHRAGITHRDVKPGNVLVGEDGQVKLTDFGIARNVSEATMTRTGIVLGSPAFIAPEIASGDPVTPAADLWSLGATLFAAVEGRAPYNVRGDVLATLNEVVNGPVPVAESAGPLALVIAGLMRKDPAGRMTPTEIRRSVYRLLPGPGGAVFGTAELGIEDQATDEYPLQGRDTGTHAGGSTVSGAVEGAPLSADPGPLPFTAPPRRTARTRGGAASAGLGAAAVVLFAVAGTGAFALTRTVAGEPLTPQQPAASTPVAAPTTTRRPILRPTTDEASVPSADSGGGFSISVPPDWMSFTERKASRTFRTSAVVHYVSSDGRREVTVERLPHFYPRNSIKRYLHVLRQSWPDDRLTVLSVHEAGGAGDGGADAPRRLTYRTFSASHRPDGGAALGRTTFAKLVPDGSNLWVVSVVVPTDQEDRGANKLYPRIVPSFHPTGS